ncbi:MAG TPA: site-specific integrase [Thermoanaerobacterales bacterium]|nr:site-specific integrase [Thermoanaerobacterales bacterium]
MTTGSLQIKYDKYYMVINTYDRDGKRKQKWISTGLAVRGNKKRAEKLLREQLREYEQLECLIKTDMLFSDAIRHWLKKIALTVDETTLQGYEILAETQILPYFEDNKIRLIDVTRQVLQAYIDDKHQNGRRDGKGGLSPRTLRLHKNILNQTLNEAIKNGYILTNPCDMVILPPLQRYESNYYNAEQINALLEAIREETLYPLIKFTVVYGLRRSEVLGLKWDSVDLENELVTIRHTVTKVTRTVEKNKTKNATSHRSFPLLPELKTMLLELSKKEEENKRVFAGVYNDCQYIFKWDNGRPFSPDYVSRKFKNLLKKHDLPRIRFHELRHSCASFLINKGFALKDVQEWLGHSDIKITANIYGHLDVARKKSMANTFSSHIASEAGAC